MKSLDVAVVGAGLTGLSLAWDLRSEFPDLQLGVFEKSRGVGGRMATRRSGAFTFDHGAQYLKIDGVSEPWIQLWRDSGVLSDFSLNSQLVTCGRGGMTQLAKVLARDLPIHLEQKITRLRPSFGEWEIVMEDDSIFLAKNVILTCPLPQSLEILERSSILFDRELSKIKYAMALVALVELSSSSRGTFIYQESSEDNIFSMTFQDGKGVSEAPCLTVVMNPDWSQVHFETPEDQVSAEILKMLKSRVDLNDINRVQIKKWRYSHPLSTWKTQYYSPAPQLYLAGDAFGGASLLGALRSAEALGSQLASDSKKLFL